jgi:phospholipid N-methyltransferase
MFNIVDEFYPTPPSLINKMVSDIDFNRIKTILEPSAGSGNIVEKVIEKMKHAHHSYYSREEKKYDIDCIEIDQNLRYILQGKGLKVIHDDFLTYDGFKKYDLVIMNPPFSNGDKHVLKALELIEQGGQLVAIINAETIKNPYSNIRKDLINKLNTYNASIEYLQEEFKEAERTTNVEIALIKVNIENKNRNSIILENLKQEEIYKQSENQYNSNSLIDSDFIKGIVQQYQFEIKAGLKLINEYRNLQPLILGSFKKDNYL